MAEQGEQQEDRSQDEEARRASAALIVRRTRVGRSSRVAGAFGSRGHHRAGPNRPGGPRWSGPIAGTANTKPAGLGRRALRAGAGPALDLVDSPGSAGASRRIAPDSRLLGPEPPGRPGGRRPGRVRVLGVLAWYRPSPRAGCQQRRLLVPEGRPSSSVRGFSPRSRADLTSACRRKSGRKISGPWVLERHGDDRPLHRRRARKPSGKTWLGGSSGLRCSFSFSPRSARSLLI